MYRTGFSNNRATLLVKAQLLLSYSKQSLNPIYDDTILILSILIGCII